MTETIRVEVTGDSRDIENALRQLYNAFEPAVLDVKLLRGMVGPELQEVIKKRFESEGDDASGQWLPLAEPTVAIREAAGYGGAHPINVRTGAMKKALVEDPPRSTPNSLGATMWIPGDISSDVKKKISVAQSGGMTPDGRNVPARPVLALGALDLETTLESLKNYIREEAPLVVVE